MTLADFRKLVLIELGVLQAGESVTTEDSDLIDDHNVKERSRLRDHVWWNVDDAIPDEASSYWILIMAYSLSRPFGINQGRRLALRADAMTAENRLAALSKHQAVVTSPATNY